MKITKLEYLNIIRKRRGITLIRLSDSTRLSVGFLGNVVGGNYARISDKSKRKIARALSVPVETIFKMHEEKDHKHERKNNKDLSCSRSR